MKVGFLINPVAGMGGSVALKGTDGEETLRRARELGAVPRANLRAETAVGEFAEASSGHVFLAPSGEMGAGLLKKYGLCVSVVRTVSEKTAAEDTKQAAAEMLSAGAELIIFAGGDGTARDVCSVVSDKIPVIGIPAGVKIHSGVYAKRPKDAGMLIRSFLLGKIKRFSLAEVEDIDEEAFRENIVRAKLYGYMKVPDDREFMQERKSGGQSKEADSALNLAAYVISAMRHDELYLIGSGSTTASITQSLGIGGTLLGVDAVVNKELRSGDLTERGVITQLEKFEREKRHLVVTVIGGQGYIFGRGNQQLSPEALRMIPKENIMVIATERKMSQLFGRALLVDTGDTELDEKFKGYIPVITGINKRIMAKIA